MKKPELISIDDYTKFADQEGVSRIRKKARAVKGMHVAHVNST